MLEALGMTWGSRGCLPSDRLWQRNQSPSLYQLLGCAWDFFKPSSFAIQTGTIGPEACFQNLGKQMFLFIFLSLMPKCSLRFHWVLKLPFFFFFKDKSWERVIVK